MRWSTRSEILCSLHGQNEPEQRAAKPRERASMPSDEVEHQAIENLRLFPMH